MTARVTLTSGSISGVRRAAKRYRCDGHLTDHHFIEAGQQYVANALPPGDPEIGNHRWWHLRLCMDCCPLTYAKET